MGGVVVDDQADLEVRGHACGVVRQRLPSFDRVIRARCAEPFDRPSRPTVLSSSVRSHAARSSVRFGRLQRMAAFDASLKSSTGTR